jgi:Flp pilus assembly protein TadD
MLEMARPTHQPWLIARREIVTRRFVLLAPFAILAGLLLPQADAQKTIRITIPRHSELTPVQRLNRDGVEAVRRQEYDKAEAIFYKAYLYDPSDPFTLNNLGYIAELQGQLDRAQGFYKLAAEQGTDAFIDQSNEKELEGRRMSDALDSLKDLSMRVNRMNFDAMTLLSENRRADAETLLQTALRLDPQNSFTLNNLGVAEEALGDYSQALKDYRAAAASGSTDPAAVTLTGAWRGRPISQMAADNAQRLETRLQEMNNSEARAALLASRGVAAINRNDWNAAREDFLEAYKLDPYSAFSLNNAGYVAEREGDVETAEFFYAKAQQANNAGAPVGMATGNGAPGKTVAAVAIGNDQETEDKLDRQREARREQKGPIELLHRDGTPVAPAKPAQSAPNSAPPAPESQPQP